MRIGCNFESVLCCAGFRGKAVVCVCKFYLLSVNAGIRICLKYIFVLIYFSILNFEFCNVAYG